MNIYQCQQLYASKTLPTWKSFVFPFTKTMKVFGWETEKTWPQQQQC